MLLMKSRVRVPFVSWHAFNFGVNSSELSTLRITAVKDARPIQITKTLDSRYSVMFQDTATSPPLVVTETLPLSVKRGR